MNIDAPLPAPAEPGANLADVDTPALLLNLDAFERNLDTMDATLAGRPVRIRPHAKSHKCPEIARRQIARGAAGVCCQKVSEAEALVRGGIEDVVVVNEVVGALKLGRLARLARDARIGVAVDDAGNIEDIERAAHAAGVTLDVFVEVEVGLNRCGVEPGPPVLALARRVAEQRHLRFAGLQAYHGRAQHVRSFDERRVAAAAAAGKVRLTLDMLEADGLQAKTVTGGGTGTFQFDASSGVYNEVQPGSYVFMDADYAQNLDGEGRPVRSFEHSLFVLTTVMSHPIPERAAVDAGLKAHSVDSGMPLVVGVPGARYTRASDEHGILELAGPGTLVLGQKLRLIPGHCDPTVNLHDWLVCYRGDRVEAVWRVAARGAFY
ncbi:MAG TPA: DSD1 family PLP-dependent enzyme [Vicinamibacterales bacterium]|jgi:D-serine deaminase-like pyridoxal phosphate-dependent protein